MNRYSCLIAAAVALTLSGTYAHCADDGEDWRRISKLEGERAEALAYLSDEDAKALLALVRGHWGIENKLHWVRDETLGEDRCRVRHGSAAQALAAIRNVAVYLLGQVDPKNKAAATRHLAAHPRKALALLRC